MRSPSATAGQGTRRCSRSSTSLLVAFLVAFLARRVGLALVAVAVALELLVWHGRGARVGELPLRDRARRVRDALRRTVSRRPRRPARRGEARRCAGGGAAPQGNDDLAREFRLTASGAGTSAPDGDARWQTASVVEVENAMRGALEVAEVALRSHTCAVFLLDAAGERLALRECRRSPSDAVARGLSAREGALGAAIARRTSVRLHGEIKVATYYEDGSRPGALFVVPLVDRRGGHVRGVIVADRREPAPAWTRTKLVQTLCAETFRRSRRSG